MKPEINFKKCASNDKYEVRSDTEHSDRVHSILLRQCGCCIESTIYFGAGISKDKNTQYRCIECEKKDNWIGNPSIIKTHRLIFDRTKDHPIYPDLYKKLNDYQNPDYGDCDMVRVPDNNGCIGCMFQKKRVRCSRIPCNPRMGRNWPVIFKEKK